MNNRISYNDVISRLDENGLQYGVLTLQNDVKIIVTRYGGRIFGPFLSEEDSSILWMNKVFSCSDAFKEYLKCGSWNLGGDRIWIAPEIQFSVRDRENFWNTLETPSQVDPGSYSIDRDCDNRCILSQNMVLDAYNLSSGTKDLFLQRTIQKTENPLRSLSNHEELMKGVIYAGFEQEIMLKEGRNDGIMAEAWNLTQVNPGGVALICSTPCVEYIDYYEPVDEVIQTIDSNHVRLKITGNRRYKVGYKAAHVFGRLAYYNNLDDGRSYLLVRNFFNNPSSVYSEEPAEKPGSNGYSIHIYNDDGNFGGFGELECNAQTIGGKTGKSSSLDQLVSWLYVGPADRIKNILLCLTAVRL